MRLLAALVLSVATLATADDLPELTQPVNDFAHVIDAFVAARPGDSLEERDLRKRLAAEPIRTAD